MEVIPEQQVFEPTPRPKSSPSKTILKERQHSSGKINLVTEKLKTKIVPTLNHDSKSDPSKSDKSNKLHGDSEIRTARPYECPQKAGVSRKTFTDASSTF